MPDEKEYIRIFDHQHRPLGIATRAEAHKHGYWHETFHYWLIDEEKQQIYFQLRSLVKKDYPNLLDITAAGHLLSHETALDGVREVKEEIGIEVSIDDLHSLGVLAYSVKNDHIHDNEHAHVFLHRKNQVTLDEFQLQASEVSGIYHASLTDFADLMYGRKAHITITGFEESDGIRVTKEKQATQQDFVPHKLEFYHELIAKLLR